MRTFFRLLGIVGLTVVVMVVLSPAPFPMDSNGERQDLDLLCWTLDALLASPQTDRLHQLRTKGTAATEKSLIGGSSYATNSIATR
jgi:hypothetical protein